jgi:hypothetical protein
MVNCIDCTRIDLNIESGSMWGGLGPFHKLYREIEKERVNKVPSYTTNR